MPNWQKLTSHEPVGTRNLFKDIIEFAHVIVGKPCRKADGSRSRMTIRMMAVFYGKAAGQ